MSNNEQKAYSLPSASLTQSGMLGAVSKQDKINRIVQLRNGIRDLKNLKKEVKAKDNSKRLKTSNMNNWAKECLDNSAWVEPRINKLDYYINLAQTEIEKLKLEIEFAQ